jgi:hypothetical protein
MSDSFIEELVDSDDYYAWLGLSKDVSYADVDAIVILD